MVLIDDSYICKLKQRLAEIHDTPTEKVSSPLINNHSVKEALLRISSLQNTREHSSKELHAKLARESFQENTIEEALRQARESKVVDDMRYAEAFVRKARAEGRGRQGILRKLEYFDIDISLLPECGEDILPSEEEELAQALALLRKKPPTAKNKQASAYRRLQGKGYDSTIANRATRLWIEEIT